MPYQKKSRLKPLLQGAIVWSIAAVSVADYQAGYDAYQAGDYERALAEWKAAVSQTPAREELALYRESLYAIGMLYWQGEGVNQDYATAVVWLKQAADINHPGAQTKLGYLYSTGQGVPVNYAEAARYLQMAAAQGDADAQYNLDLLEREGLIPAGGQWAETGRESGDAQLPQVAAAEESPPDEPIAEPLADIRSEAEFLPGQDAGEAWIQNQDPAHYTIQVIALSAPDKLHAFIADSPDWAPFAIYRQTRYEQPLWVLVQGAYPNVEAARAARDAFPRGIQKRDDLWIRKFEMVQRLIE